MHLNTYPFTLGTSLKHTEKKTHRHNSVERYATSVLYFKKYISKKRKKERKKGQVLTC